MPFVILCGYPCSGKTTRSLELKDYFKKTKHLRTVIISEHDRGLQRNVLYSDSNCEKQLRSTLKSEVQRTISKDDVLILDSLNYIKGFRYELYCITKSAQTPHCLVYCDVGQDEVSEWNAARSASEQYSPDILEGLVMRFEAPDSRNRWDSPVFNVHASDSLPYDHIYDVLFARQPPPPNLSTLPQPLSATNYLHELDTVTQAIVTSVLDAQKTWVPGSPVSVNGTTDKLHLTHVVTLMEMQRLRRQFISFSKHHAAADSDSRKIADLFVQFLNNRLQ